MIFGLFTLAVAIFISGVSAFYSVTGLTAIFAAAFWPIVIMGGALEIGKITATVWLHKYWNRAGWQFKLYLVPAIVILMLITSMGTYGYLAKAHMDQSVTVGDSSAQVQILDEKIKTEQDNIASAKKALAQMDSQVDQMLSRTTDDKGTSKAVTIRKQQAGERKSLQTEITTAQKHIAELQNERAPLAAASRKVEAEVGPIKYIAALIYGDNPNADLLERAVRWVIILLVFVFDPLALILILAAEQTIAWARDDKKKADTEAKQREGWHQEWIPDTEAWPEWDDEVTEEQIEAIKQEANVDDDIEMKSFFDEGKELAKEIDDNNGHLVQTPSVEENTVDKHAYLKKPWVWNTKQTVGPQVAAPVSEPTVVEPPAPPAAVQHDPEPINRHPAPAMDEAPINPLPKAVVVHEASNQITIPDFSIGAESATPVNAGFGDVFPTSPARGDMFLRTDYLPSKLYKWNEKKWIEVDKDKTDSFAYDEEYIKHLINKIDSGEYDVDLLTPTEQEQIQRYLENGRTTT